ncbi:MAG TPA: hypothetical protein VJ485_04105 [archaeon]|nr:hypothetical protein [archaeon]
MGLPLYGPQVQAYRKDISLVSNNLESEFPRALNLGLREGSVQEFADFSRFAKGTLAGQNMQFKGLWVVSQPQGTDLKVTVGNFMGQTQAVSITVGMDSRDLNMLDDSTQAAVFSGAADSFQIRIAFPGHSWTSVWLRNKANLYAFTEIARATDTVIEEVEA